VKGIVSENAASCSNAEIITTVKIFIGQAREEYWRLIIQKNINYKHNVLQPLLFHTWGAINKTFYENIFSFY
jgi:hypothetical protein